MNKTVASSVTTHSGPSNSAAQVLANQRRYDCFYQGIKVYVIDAMSNNNFAEVIKLVF